MVAPPNVSECAVYIGIYIEVYRGIFLIRAIQMFSLLLLLFDNCTTAATTQTTAAPDDTRR